MRLMMAANADGEPTVKELKSFQNSWSLQCSVSGGGEPIAAKGHILKEYNLESQSQ
jgi:hypothetical protein